MDSEKKNKKLFKDEKLYDIFDTFEQKDIKIKHYDLAKLVGINLEISYKFVRQLNNFRTLKDRYILACNKHVLFVLVDLDTEKEYVCASNQSIFKQLNVEYNESTAKYIYALRTLERLIVCIGNHNLFLKGRYPYIFKGHLKYKGDKFKQLYENQKTQKKIKNCLQKRLKGCLLQAQTPKKYKTLDFLGCDLDFFIKYIENQFVEGMNWQNHGKYMKNNINPVWHIDHILPCSSFDLTKEEEQRKCFHYTNLRPLWAIENLKRPRFIHFREQS